MTRKFLDDVRTQVDTLLADNNAGDISPLDVRTVLNNIIDSTIQDEAQLASTAAFTPYTLSVGSYAVIGGSGVYDTSRGDDGDWLNINLNAGTVTGSATPGYSYTVKAGVTFSGLANNEVVDLAIGVNDTPQGFVTNIVGDGGSRPGSRYWEGGVLTAGTSDVFSIMAQTDTAGTIQIDAITLTVIVEPTNNAT